MHVAEAFRRPLAIPFWIVFFFAFVREGRVIRGAIGNPPCEQDHGTFRALMIGSPVTMLVAAGVSLLPWLAIEHSVAALVAGMGLLVCGAVLRRLCFNALGQSFTGTVLVSRGQRLVQDGVYRLIRHPSYTAAFLMFTGIGFALGSWISVAILFLVHCYLYGVRVSVEERALLETLGEPYREYMARTKRFIPFVV